ncbi:MAG: hypothetical protein JNL87_14820 [Burkholderiaceae bacterium]|nr:hypothetical protein [Burkholderiaceae bacterium]
MSAVTTPEQPAPSLVEIIDFKWLMAGDGHRVHVEHLQADRDYACACLALAAGSRVKALRDTAARLAASLGMPLPAPAPRAGSPAAAGIVRGA